MSKILVIDDDLKVQAFLKKSLQSEDVEVIVAGDGQTGLELAQKLCPSLIVCDWLMPGLDGLEVCRQVKADPTLATTFFIVLSAKGGVKDRVEGLNTGADDFLAKPVDLSELRARVRAGLRLHQLSKDLKHQKELLEAELHEAADYVRSLLPPPMVEPVKITSRFVPSRQLGGDCFDYYWLDPDYLAIYLLDVSGHGLGAALPSISVQNVLRSQSLPDVNFYRPASVLQGLNEAFQMNDQNDKYFTMWYGVYNHRRRFLTYASAGHPPAVLIAADADGVLQDKRLRTPNLPIGMMANASYDGERCSIPVNSSLYIFSDGAYESFDYGMDPSEYVWGLDEFVALLSAHHGSDNSLDQVLMDIRKTRQQQSFPDDLSLLQVTFI